METQNHTVLTELRYMLCHGGVVPFSQGSIPELTPLLCSHRLFHLSGWHLLSSVAFGRTCLILKWVPWVDIMTCEITITECNTMSLQNYEFTESDVS